MGEAAKKESAGNGVRIRNPDAVAGRFLLIRVVQTAFSTRQVLLPPKPNEFDAATRTFAGRASFATWQRSHSGSGSSKLIVGGSALRSIAATHANASTAAAAVNRWPVMLLVELTGMRFTASPNTVLRTRSFRHVADRRTRGVGVDVIHLIGRDAGVVERLAHGRRRRFRVRAGDDHVMGVAAGAKAGHLRIDAGRVAGRLLALQHEHGAALGHHETVAAAVERARRGSRLGVAPR